MSRYLPAVAVTLILGVGIGIAQNLLNWGPWPLFFACLGSIVVIGLLAVHDDLRHQ